MHTTTSSFASIHTAELDRVVGGAVNTAAWQQALQQAAPYCPSTVKKYGGLDPSSLTRGKAQQIGNACLSEMGPFDASMGGRSAIQGAINNAFPR